MSERIVYIIESTVVSVEEKHETIEGRKVKGENGMPDSTDLTTRSLGWFIRVEGMLVSIGLGHEKPNCEVGTKVRIGIELNPKG